MNGTCYESVSRGYAEMVYRTQHEVAHGRWKIELFLKNDYSVSLVVECTFCQGLNILPQSALLISIFSFTFPSVALHHVLAVICRLEGTVEEVGVELVSNND